MEKTLYGETDTFGEDVKYLDSEANRCLIKVRLSATEHHIVLSRDEWLNLPLAMRSRTLRLAIGALAGLTDVTRVHLQDAMALIESGKGKKHTLLPRSLRIELESGKIILSK